MTLDTIYKAFDILKKYKNINISCTSCEITKPDTIELNNGFKIMVPHAPRLELTATVCKTCGQAMTTYELEYVIWQDDLLENSIVNNIIDLKHITNEETKQTLRLAWILLDGYKYAVDHIMKKDYLELNWHPRVVKYTQNAW